MARARKVCSAPHCPELQPCPVHGRKPWEGSTRRDNLRKRSGSRQQKLRRFVLARDENTCHVCGHEFPDDQLVADHVIPLAEGGEDHVDNLAPCCLEDHRKKTAEEARRGRS